MPHSKPRTAATVDRRGFLKAGVAAAIGSAVAASGVVAAGEPSAEAKPIPARAFGKTGRVLPILGYGGAALPKAWANPLSLEERVKLVRYAYDRGLRYFDTAGNYMESQSILGEGLRASATRFTWSPRSRRRTPPRSEASLKNPSGNSRRTISTPS